MQSRRQTLADIVARLSEKLDDKTNTRWATATKYEAINLAIQAAWPRWWEIVDIFPFATYDADTFAYLLPEGLDDIIAVYFEPNVSGRPWWLVRSWHVDGQFLYIQDSYKDYDGQRMRLVGVRTPWEFNTNSVMGTDGVTTAGEATLTSASAEFVADDVRPGDCVWIWGANAVDADKKVWLVKSVDSETQLTVYGEFATTVVGDVKLTWFVGYHTFVPNLYLVHKAASELFQLSGHKGAGQDIVEDMQWAEFHAQMAEYYIDIQGKAYPSRRTA